MTKFAFLLGFLLKLVLSLSFGLSGNPAFQIASGSKISIERIKHVFLFAVQPNFNHMP